MDQAKMVLLRLRPNRFLGAMFLVLMLTILHVVEAAGTEGSSFPVDCDQHDCLNGGECRRRGRLLSESEHQGEGELVYSYYCDCRATYEGVHCEKQRRLEEGETTFSPRPTGDETTSPGPTPTDSSLVEEPTVSPTPASPESENFSSVPTSAPSTNSTSNEDFGGNGSSAPFPAPADGGLDPPSLEPPSESPAPAGDTSSPAPSPAPAFSDNEGFPLLPTNPPTDPPGKRPDDGAKDPPVYYAGQKSAANANYDDGDLSGGHIFGITLAVFCFLLGAYCLLSNRKPRPRRGLDGMHDLELTSGWANNHHDNDGLL